VREHGLADMSELITQLGDATVAKKRVSSGEDILTGCLPSCVKMR